MVLPRRRRHWKPLRKGIAVSARNKDSFSETGARPSESHVEAIRKTLKAKPARIKPKKFEYVPGVIRDQEGEILAGGDLPEPEGAKEFSKWMKACGCLGLDHIQLQIGGGVWLRKTVQPTKKNTILITVPREAWLTPGEGEDPTCADALAWQLLLEAWAGAKSRYAPFVQRLQEWDVSSHPIMWEPGEVEWLRASPEGYREVTTKRAEAEERRARLLARARSSDALPEELVDDEEELDAWLLWAICILEVHGLQMKGKDPNAPPPVALCPMVTEIRSVGTVDAPAFMTFDANNVFMFAHKPLRPGQEVTQAVESSMSGGWLLANLGLVPGSEKLGIPSDSELIDLHAGGASSWLYVPDITASQYSGSALHLNIKLDILKKYAGLDLKTPLQPDEDVPLSVRHVKIPDEAVEKGRLMPAARFILMDPGEEYLAEGAKDTFENLFFFLFRHCEFEGGYPPADPEIVARIRLATDVEIEARKLVAQWCCVSIGNFTAAIDQIAADTGLPVGTTDGLVQVLPGQTVMSHFKAVKQNGTQGKSRKPREARVLSVEGAHVRLEFLANKRRHEVPGSWITDAQPVSERKLLTSGCTAERVARGKLAITLLRTERAHLGQTLISSTAGVEALQQAVKNMELMEEAGDDIGVARVAQQIRDMVLREMGELDEDFEKLFPERFADLPAVRTLEEVDELNDEGKRILPLPPVDGFKQVFTRDKLVKVAQRDQLERSPGADISQDELVDAAPPDAS